MWAFWARNSPFANSAVRLGRRSEASRHGIQTELIDVGDLGKLGSKPAFQTRVERYRAAIRIAAVSGSRCSDKQA